MSFGFARVASLVCLRMRSLTRSMSASTSTTPFDNLPTPCLMPLSHDLMYRLYKCRTHIAHSSSGSFSPPVAARRTFQRPCSALRFSCNFGISSRLQISPANSPSQSKRILRHLSYLRQNCEIFRDFSRRECSEWRSR
jgi:hypothetical protein